MSFIPFKLTANETLDLLEEYVSDLRDFSDDDDDDADVVFVPPVEETDAVSNQDTDLSDDGAKDDTTRFTEKSSTI